MLDGPYDVDTHSPTSRRCSTRWAGRRAYLVGHSWGGHLGFHLAVATPDRVSGLLSVDPLGAVGDGGEAAMGAEMISRFPAETRQRAKELDERALAGEGTEADALEGLRLSGRRTSPTGIAPPMPPISLSGPAYSECFESMPRTVARPRVGAAVDRGAARDPGGARSPMPVEQSARHRAAAFPGAWVEVVEGAGHFPWVEKPGCVRSALDRLARLMARWPAVVAALERRYDPAWAAEWDAVGLVCGDPDGDVGRVLVAVDPVEVVVDEAISSAARSCVVTHHPLFLGGTESVAATTAKGRVVHRLVTTVSALFVAHTNADVAARGQRRAGRGARPAATCGRIEPG